MNGACWRPRRCGPCEGAAMDRRVIANVILGFGCIGLVFSVGWTPCVGAFLGSALIALSCLLRKE